MLATAQQIKEAITQLDMHIEWLENHVPVSVERAKKYRTELVKKLVELGEAAC